MKMTQLLAVMLCSSVMAASSAWGLGRDEGRGDIRPPYIASNPELRWQDQGIGGWRTHDGAGNPVLRDWGFNVYDYSPYYYEAFNACRQICELIRQCHGIEFRTVGTVPTPANLSENGITYHYNKCEIHYDPFLACERSAASDSPVFDGCWTRLTPAYPFGHRW